MKIPRNLNADDLIKLLKFYGYLVTRQSGSHLRLISHQNGQHHITIPNHNPLKIGILSAIISDVANHFNNLKKIL